MQRAFQQAVMLVGRGRAAASGALRAAPSLLLAELRLSCP
jgi:hypothetical protein